MINVETIAEIVLSESSIIGIQAGVFRFFEENCKTHHKYNIPSPMCTLTLMYTELL